MRDEAGGTMEPMTPAGTRSDPCGDQAWLVEMETHELSGMLMWCHDELGEGGWDYQLIRLGPGGWTLAWRFDRQEHAFLFQMVWC